MKGSSFTLSRVPLSSSDHCFSQFVCYNCVCLLHILLFLISVSLSSSNMLYLLLYLFFPTNWISYFLFTISLPSYLQHLYFLVCDAFSSLPSTSPPPCQPHFTLPFNHTSLSPCLPHLPVNHTSLSTTPLPSCLPHLHDAKTSHRVTVNPHHN